MVDAVSIGVQFSSRIQVRTNTLNDLEKFVLKYRNQNSLHNESIFILCPDFFLQ